jgi:hypothetical protein
MSRLKSHATAVTAKQMALFNEIETDTEFSAEWEAIEIVALQRGMLIYAIEEIRDRRRSRAMRIDAWNWLMSNDDHSFSSILCAKNNGYDINHLRWLIKRLINDL